MTVIDSSPKDSILNDTLGLLYCAKSLRDTIHEIKRGECGSLLIIENFFENYQSTWGEEIKDKYLQAMIHIASCLDKDDDNLQEIVHSMTELQWIREMLFKTFKQLAE